MPLAAEKCSPSPEELTEIKAIQAGRGEEAGRRGDLPGAMLAVGGRARLQSQVSDSPCCFAHWLMLPPALMQCPLTAAGGLAAYAKAEFASFIYLLRLQPPSDAGR